MSEREYITSGSMRVVQRELWEYQDLTGAWNEPGGSVSLAEAAESAKALGTAYRRVTIETTYQRFEI